MGTNQLRQNLSKNMKKFRRELGLTQETLAEKADLSMQMISDIEGCRSWVSDKSLIKIATALNCSPYNLFLPYDADKKASPVSDTLIVLAELKAELGENVERIINAKINSIKKRK